MFRDNKRQKTCEECFVSFSVEMLEEEYEEDVIIEFCPFCGEAIIEDDDEPELDDENELDDYDEL